MGSFLFARIAGLENNIYLQTGAIMLIGLLAKTAILITEYAIERRVPDGYHLFCLLFRTSRFRPTYHDCALYDIRYASADVLKRCRSQWQPVLWQPVS